MELPRYFWNGFQHALLGLGFAFIFHTIVRKNYFMKSAYLFGLIMSSSALFFLPGHIGRYGSLLDRLYQFSHYPLSDWDILFLGMDWHRFFITHSMLIPAVLLIMFLHKPTGYTLGLGLSVGLSSHLVWDAISCSMYTPVVFLNDLFEIRGYWGKGWLMLNGMLLFGLACFIHRKFQETDTTKLTRS